MISNNGEWVAFDLSHEMAGENDPDERMLYIKQVDGKKAYEIPLGSDARLSDDSEWVAYFVSLPKGGIYNLIFP